MMENSSCCASRRVSIPRNDYRLGTAGPPSYRGRMSILLEAIGAVVQGVIEAAADLIFRSRDENQQDDVSDE